MGTGKSTIGKILAERIGWTFVDTDQEIAKREKQSIEEIFSNKGESYFRDVESRVLADLAKGDMQVVTTGGGVVIRKENFRHMRSNGFIISLHATPETIIERVKFQSGRPLLQGDVEERVRRILKERTGLYDQGDLVIDTTSKSVDEIVHVIMNEPTVPLR